MSQSYRSERLRYLACRYLLFWLPDTWFLSLNYFFYHLGSGWNSVSVTPWRLARLRRAYLNGEAPLIDSVFAEFDQNQVLPPSFD
ncbi:MAG: hypothetical protein ACO3DK_05835, partial [Bacteroidia bacterium]